MSTGSLDSFEITDTEHFTKLLSFLDKAQANQNDFRSCSCHSVLLTHSAHLMWTAKAKQWGRSRTVYYLAFWHKNQLEWFLAFQLSRSLHVISVRKSTRCARCRHFRDLTTSGRMYLFVTAQTRNFIDCQRSVYKVLKIRTVKLHADLVTLLCISSLFKASTQRTKPHELHLCCVKAFEFFVAICPAY